MVKQITRCTSGATGDRQNRAKAGIGLTEIMATILTLAAGTAVFDSVPSAEDSAVESYGNRAEAVAIAHGQMSLLKGLRYQEVRPTPAYRLFPDGRPGKHALRHQRHSRPGAGDQRRSAR